MQTDKPASYRYYNAGKDDGRGYRVRFCYSCWRNAAGYFLSWREIERERAPTKTGWTTKRDMWSARKVRKRARALAEKRAKAFRTSREN